MTLHKSFRISDHADSAASQERRLGYATMNRSPEKREATVSSPVPSPVVNATAAEHQLIERTVLDNGLTVVSERMPHVRDANPGPLSGAGLDELFHHVLDLTRREIHGE